MQSSNAKAQVQTAILEDSIDSARNSTSIELKPKSTKVSSDISSSQDDSIETKWTEYPNISPNKRKKDNCLIKK